MDKVIGIRILRWFSYILLMIILVIAFCNFWIILSTKNHIYNSINKIPGKNVALILGTSKYSKKGNPNQYFHNRMDAAAALYYGKKVKHFIVSGDNSVRYYNEPLDMKKALLKKGIPDSIITLDHAGLRTFDSVVRSKKIFSQDSIIIVTQKFHLYRALFISDYYDMKAIGFEANHSVNTDSYATILREVLARFLAVIDLYIIKKTPKFLGKQEKILFS